MSEEALYSSILDPAMSEYGRRLSTAPKPAKFDFVEFMGLCDAAMSSFFGVEIR